MLNFDFFLHKNILQNRINVFLQSKKTKPQSCNLLAISGRILVLFLDTLNIFFLNLAATKDYYYKKQGFYKAA